MAVPELPGTWIIADALPEIRESVETPENDGVIQYSAHESLSEDGTYFSQKNEQNKNLQPNLGLGSSRRYDGCTTDIDDRPYCKPPNVGEKYFFYEDEILGHGSTSEVHLGRNRKTGEHVAVKVVKKNFAPHTKRETELLERLKHENIVKLIAVETDKLFRPWLILEWSKTGSVGDLLSLPQNKFGLSEEDLLAFLENMESVTHQIAVEQITNR
ncbi:hypothetical protein CAPTEDRAFT_202957 [Capitella teleta]|uniref:Protein kinase domain-containing protein n=1 Tax=Capitella teleta TaxID=283909 RepID=R7U0Q4_CAPTE|nr:hypothetical protein CAPTEDRAFT_202957 [Capitella teleta]|eukprot:ELT99442.1 hypothetical protein CAPTEDRAFT_202957 [Capitella teleta]